MNEDIRKLLDEIKMVAKDEVEQIEADARKNKPVFVIAPNIHLAKRYAMTHGISKLRFRYVHDEHTLYGLAGAEVLWVNRDQRGDFDFSKRMWDMLYLARDLAEAKRITLRSVSMDDPKGQI